MRDRIAPPFCHFLASADSLSILPPPVCSEVAFWGRSNVGKSSLLNALMGRKKLARSSKTPGCTQKLNFYQVHPHLRFVDLPGYGYSKVPASLQAKWDPLLSAYFSKRETLHHVYLLLDGRHGPKPLDYAAHDFLQALGVPYHLVFTKEDKMSIMDKQTCTEKVSTWMPSLPPYFVSTRTLESISLLRDNLESQFLPHSN